METDMGLYEIIKTLSDIYNCTDDSSSYVQGETADRIIRICNRLKISESDLIDLFKNNISDNKLIEFLLKSRIIPESVMTQYSKHFTEDQWDIISEYQKLSHDFMREYENDLNIKYLCKYQELSEPFMRRNSKSLDWSYVKRYQKLSVQYIKEFKSELGRLTDIKMLKNKSEREIEKILGIR